MEYEASFPFYQANPQKLSRVRELMRNKRALIVIPTYNEVQNIGPLVNSIFMMEIPNLELLVVDDSSPDGTAGKVRVLQGRFPGRVHLIVREKKAGLGSAYVRGFKFALERDYDYIFEMDADFSHDPKEIPNFLLAVQDSDLVIGSRYIQGVNVINWPLSRLLLSYYANLYTRVVTGLKIHDCTSGFKCYRRKVLEAINLDKISSDGYAFQIEMHFKAWKLGFRVKEIPIVFVDRVQGSSKMNKKIIREAVWEVWRLRLLSILGKVE